MDMNTIHMISGTVGLLIFVFLFVGMLIYALWPANQSQFDKAANSVLKHDNEEVGQ